MEEHRGQWGMQNREKMHLGMYTWSIRSVGEETDIWGEWVSGKESETSIRVDGLASAVLYFIVLTQWAEYMSSSSKALI